jgi:ribokinase
VTPTVIVVGSVNVDLVVRAPRLPAPGETVTGGQFSRHPGGKGGNQAVAAARLGARVAMVGAVGDDDHGEAALDDLRGARVDVSRVLRLPAPTGVAAIIVDDAGENQIAVASGANHLLGADEVREAVDGLAVDGAVVLISLELADAAVAAAVEAAESAGLPVVLNPGPARPLPDEVLGAVTVLTPNRHEVGGLGPAGVAGLLELGVGAVS